MKPGEHGRAKRPADHHVSNSVRADVDHIDKHKDGVANEGEDEHRMLELHEGETQGHGTDHGMTAGQRITCNVFARAKKGRRNQPQYRENDVPL